VAVKGVRKTRLRVPKPPGARLSAMERRDVTRAEFNQVIDLLHERGEIIAGLMKELEIQFKRMAQIQSELDEVRQAWQRWKRTESDGET
jgi:hypothetical protein